MSHIWMTHLAEAGSLPHAWLPLVIAGLPMYQPIKPFIDSVLKIVLERKILIGAIHGSGHLMQSRCTRLAAGILHGKSRRMTSRQNGAMCMGRGRGTQKGSCSSMMACIMMHWLLQVQTPIIVIMIVLMNRSSWSGYGSACKFTSLAQ